MNESEIDMDELEARLYGQVHYMPDCNETLPTRQELTNFHSKKLIRYFDGAPSASSTPMGLYSIPVISPPINNIVVLPSTPAQVYNHQKNSQKWVEQILQKYETARSKGKRKFDKLKKKTKERKILNAKKRGVNVTDSSIISTIDLSESCTPSKAKVCVISDDNSNCSDDVVFVETKSEIIDVDCDTDRSSSPVSSNGLNVGDLSMSNDFLDNATISNVGTSTPFKDVRDTASNCSSTIDYSENLKGKDVEPVVPTSSAFSELNLDSFTNYITSNGKRSAEIATLTPSTFSAKRARRVSASSSNSSSESEGLSMGGVSEQEEELGSTRQEAEMANDDGGVEIEEKGEDTVICIDDEKSDTGATEEAEVKNKYEPERFSKYWTEDMNKFYRESWGQEKFSVIEEQRRMSDDPNMWKIIVKDRMLPDKKSRDPRCRRCMEFGHIAPNCTKHLGPIKCCLCGAVGHKDTRCPNTFCTSCREKTPYYTTFCSRCVNRREITCSMCSMTGHCNSDCPDLWRRYLFTTKNGSVEQPAEANIKVAEDRWCSGCGMNGHFEQHCYYYNRSHAPVSVFIHSFQDVYPPRKADDSSSHVSNPSTEVVNKEQSEQDSWYLGQAKYKLLLGKEAQIFLKILRNSTSVAIKVEKTRSIILLFSGGTSQSRAATKAAIKRYIEAKKSPRPPVRATVFFNTKKPTIAALKCNLDTLKSTSTDWLGTAEAIHKQIRDLTVSVQGCTKQAVYKKHQATLKTLYQKLNTILIAKLKIGSDEQHMETLEQCVRNKQVMLYSFEYVFNSDHILYPNYEELIARLPHVPSQYANQPQCVLYENMKNSAVALCTKWKWRSRLKRILMTYSHLIVSNYSNKYVSVFKGSCARIHSLDESSRRQSETSGSKR